jgi:hypothetical protein
MVRKEGCLAGESNPYYPAEITIERRGADCREVQNMIKNTSVAPSAQGGCGGMLFIVPGIPAGQVI